MEPKELDHWPYVVYRDDSDNLYVHDRQEGLVFIRSKINAKDYYLTIIIDEDNSKYSRCMDILSPEAPCGFQIRDKLTLKEWNMLTKDYLKHKHCGKQVFDEWLEKKFYTPLERQLYEQSLFFESISPP